MQEARTDCPGLLSCALGSKPLSTPRGRVPCWPRGADPWWRL